MKVRIVTKAWNGEGYDLCQPPKWIEWSDSSDRKWLMNHMHHCMNNNKMVMLIPPFQSNPTVGSQADAHQSR